MVTLKEPANVVDEELRKINQSRLGRPLGTVGGVLIAAGIIEILFGMAAISAAAFAGVVFALLLGAAILVSGILELIGAVARNNMAGLLLGLIGIAAGILAIANPLFGLAFLTVIIGAYLLGTGLARLFGSGRTGWTRIGGAAGILLGIVVFSSISTISAGLIGLIVGLNIIIDGVLTTDAGMNLRRSIR